MKKNLKYTVIVLCESLPITHLTIEQLTDQPGTQAFLGGIDDQMPEAAEAMEEALSTLRYMLWKRERPFDLVNGVNEMIRRLREGEEFESPSPTANGDVGDIPF